MIEKHTHINLFKKMKEIRVFEESLVPLISNPPQITCPVHLYIGQEAIASGVCENLTDNDHVFSTHRSHGHYLAKGGSMKKLMAEMFGKSTGCSNGKGGSMHIGDPSIGLPGSPAIVAGSIPLAVGSALKFKFQNEPHVSVAFFGDGAMDEGVVYESFNIAKLRKFPVVFVCENNKLATHIKLENHLGDINISKKAEAFGLETFKVNGNDVIEVFSTAKNAIENARKGLGPAFIECDTYRILGHVGPNDETDMGIRTKEELNDWKNKCPLKMYEKILIESGILNDKEIKMHEKEIKDKVEDSINFALNSPLGNDAIHENSYVFKT